MDFIREPINLHSTPNDFNGILNENHPALDDFLPASRVFQSATGIFLMTPTVCCSKFYLAASLTAFVTLPLKRTESSSYIVPAFAMFDFLAVFTVL